MDLVVTGVVEDPPESSQNAIGDLFFPYTLLKNKIIERVYRRFVTAFKGSPRKQFRISNEAQE